jgi:glycosyltransferase involved in cell wall biosynthesis
VDVDVRLADALEGHWDYDVVHIFNIQSAEDSWRACQIAKANGLPVVLSTIYWDLTSMWYWTNETLKTPWRITRQVLGQRGYSLYAAWQRGRAQSSDFWQLQRRLLSAVDILLPNSEMEAQQVLRDFHLARGKVRYLPIPNAIDAALFTSTPRRPAHLDAITKLGSFVLQVGRISPEKNPVGLIRALWNVNIPLVFVGKPSPYAPAYFDACQRLGVQRGNVHFVDWLPHSELPGVYRLAAVHALPSWRETPGLVTLEAAAAGCRIVSTSIGCAYEYLGDEAWYCHPADHRSIRCAVVSALQGSPSEKLRKRIIEHYTWDKAAHATLRAYHMALRQPPAYEYTGLEVTGNEG